MPDPRPHARTAAPLLAVAPLVALASLLGLASAPEALAAGGGRAPAPATGTALRPVLQLGASETYGLGVIGWSEDDRHVLNAAGSAIVWDARTGRSLGAPDRFHKALQDLQLESFRRRRRFASVEPTREGIVHADPFGLGLLRIASPRAATPGARWLLHEAGAPIRALDVSPDDALVAAALDDGAVELIEVESGRVRARQKAPAPADRVVFSHDGASLALACETGVVELLDGRTLAPRALWRSTRRHAPPVRSTLLEPAEHFAFSHDGERLAILCDGGAIQVVDVATGREAGLFQGVTTLGIRGIAISGDGARFLVVPDKGRAALFDLTTGEVRRLPPVPHLVGGVQDRPEDETWDDEEPLLSCHAGGWVAVSATDEGRDEVTVLDLASGRRAGPFPRERPVRGDTHGAGRLVAASSDGRLLLHTDPARRAVLRDARTGAVLWTAETGFARTLRLGVEAGDARVVVSGETGERDEKGKRRTDLLLLDAKTGAPLARRKDVPPDAYRAGRPILLEPAGAFDLATLAPVPTPTARPRGSDFEETRRAQEWLLHEAEPIAGHPLAIGVATADGRRALVVNGYPNLVDYSTRFLGTLVDLEKKQALATFTLTGDDGHLLYTPDGYYLGTRDAFDALAIEAGDRAFPLETFDARLHRPDKVLERLGRASPAVLSAYETAWRRRLAKLGMAEGEASGAVAVPEVEFLEGVGAADVREKTLRLRVRATDPEGTLARLHVWVNQVPAFGSAGIDLGTEAGSAIEREVAVELTSGRNEVQVSARSRSGLESRRETLVVSYAGPAPPPSCHVVAVGVSAYRDASMNLAYAAKDARDIAALFEGMRERFAAVTTHLLLDGDAVREKILAARERLAAARPEDTVVLFVAGHGLLDERSGYWFATHDLDFASPAARGVSYDDLEGIVDGVAARTKLVFMDTCHAGEVEDDAVGPALAAAPAPGVVTRGFQKSFAAGVSAAAKGSADLAAIRGIFADLRRGSGALVVASSGGEELALESERWKNGLFTHAVISGLRDGLADRDRDFTIRFSELRAHVEETVQRLSGGRQRPAARRALLGLDPVLVDRRPAGDLPPVVSVPRYHRPQALAFSPDGALLATAGRDGKLLLVEPSTGRIARTIDAHEGARERYTLSRIGARTLAFHPWAPIVASGGTDGLVRLFEAESGEELARFGTRVPLPAPESFTPDGGNPAGGVTRHAHIERHARGYGFAFTADGRGIFLVEGGRLVLRALATGELQRTYDTRDATLVAAAGDVVAALDLSECLAGTVTARVFDVASGAPRAALAAPAKLLRQAFDFGDIESATLALSPDGRTLALGTASTLELLDLPGGRRETFPGSGFVASWSPDGSILATRRNAGESLVLRDARTLAPLLEKEVPILKRMLAAGSVEGFGQTTALTAAAFSPARPLVATAADEPETALRFFLVDVGAAAASPARGSPEEARALVGTLRASRAAAVVRETTAMLLAAEAAGREDEAGGPPLERRRAWIALRERVREDIPGTGLDDAVRARIEERVRAHGERHCAAGAAPSSERWAKAQGKDERGHWADLEVGGVVQRLRYCPPGAFRPLRAHGRAGLDAEDEIPAVEEQRDLVLLTRGFWLGETECTRALWAAISGAAPVPASQAALPAAGMSQDEVKAALARLAEARPDLGARLPTAAEWEYACRAGSDGPFACREPLARLRAPGRGPLPVASGDPNPWGFHDMQGSVEERCFYVALWAPSGEVVDPAPGEHGSMTLRGGCWDSFWPVPGYVREEQHHVTHYAHEAGDPRRGLRILVPARAPAPGER
jgi:WD40 repeat protein/formylglycine-generating enzyme required for sulfatase activity